MVNCIENVGKGKGFNEYEELKERAYEEKRVGKTESKTQVVRVMNDMVKQSILRECGNIKARSGYQTGSKQRTHRRELQTQRRAA